MATAATAQRARHGWVRLQWQARSTRTGLEVAAPRAFQIENQVPNWAAGASYDQWSALRLQVRQLMVQVGPSGVAPLQESWRRNRQGPRRDRYCSLRLSSVRDWRQSLAELEYCARPRALPIHALAAGFFSVEGLDATRPEALTAYPSLAWMPRPWKAVSNRSHSRMHWGPGRPPD